MTYSIISLRIHLMIEKSFNYMNTFSPSCFQFITLQAEGAPHQVAPGSVSCGCGGIKSKSFKLTHWPRDDGAGIVKA